MALENLSDNGRKALFGFLAVLIVIVGVWATLAGDREKAAPVAPDSPPVDEGSVAMVNPPTPEESPATRDGEPQQPKAPSSTGITIDIPHGVDALNAAARDGATFVEHYLSSDYRVEPSVKGNKTRSYLWSGSLVDVNDSPPTVQALAIMKEAKPVSTATVDKVELFLLGVKQVVFNVHVKTATIRHGKEQSVLREDYVLTLMHRGGQWKVHDLTPAGRE